MCFVSYNSKILANSMAEIHQCTLICVNLDKFFKKDFWSSWGRGCIRDSDGEFSFMGQEKSYSIRVVILMSEERSPPPPTLYAISRIHYCFNSDNWFSDNLFFINGEVFKFMSLYLFLKSIWMWSSSNISNLLSFNGLTYSFLVRLF